MKPVYALLLLMPLFLISCHDDPVSGEKRGNVEGVIDLSDKLGTAISDRGGVTVRFEEASKSTTTDAKGRWRITDLAAGIYTVTLSKPGFGTIKMFGYQYVGGGTASMEMILLVALPTYTIQELNLNADVSGISVTGRTANSDSRNFISAIMFIGNDSTVSSDPAKHRATLPVTLHPSSDGTFETGYLNLNPLMTLVSGETYYFIIYPCASPVIRYLDPKAGEFIYPSLGPTPSRVVALTIP